MKATWISKAGALVLAVTLVGCASSKDTEEEESTQQFSEHKEKVIEEEARKAEEDRKRKEAMEEQKEQVDAQLDQPEPEPEQPRQTIPESHLPAVTECDRPGNVTACGMIEGPEGEVRITASVAPAVLTKGEGQMQMGGVLARLEKQLPSLLACYGWAHLENDADSTEYDVELDVKVDGEVSAARVRANDTPVGSAGCMEERMEGWTMPAARGGGATIIATLMFAAAK